MGGGGGNYNSFHIRIIGREMTKGEMIEVCKAVSWGRWVKSRCFEEWQAQHEVDFNVASLVEFHVVEFHVVEFISI